jgi:hypothetical protein
MHGLGKDSETYFLNSDKRLRSIGKTAKYIPQNITISDEWYTQLAFALVPLIFIKPFFKTIRVEFGSNLIGISIELIQKILAFCSTVVLIFITLYLYDIMINPSKMERNRWVSIAYSVVSIYLITFLMILRLRNHELSDLICGYEYPAYIAANIEFYPLINYIVNISRNLFRIKKEISNKVRINRFFKFSIFLIMQKFIYFVVLTIFTLYLVKIPGLYENRYLRLKNAFPLQLSLIVTEIFYSAISWMICSRFKHLNRTINLSMKDTILSTYKFKLIIERYSYNIKQIIKYNRILGLGLTGYYFAMASRLLLNMRGCNEALDFYADSEQNFEFDDNEEENLSENIQLESDIDDTDESPVADSSTSESYTSSPKKSRNQISFEDKKKAVEYWKSGKKGKLSLSTVYKRYRFVTSRQQPRIWEKQIEISGSRNDKLKEIWNFTIENSKMLKKYV